MLRIGARRDLRIEMAARQRPGQEPLRLELIKVPVVGEEIESIRHGAAGLVISARSGIGVKIMNTLAITMVTARK
jgi:hypothetical protein